MESRSLKYLPELKAKLLGVTFPSQKSLGSLAMDKLKATAKQRGYKSLTSKKALHNIIGQVFLSEYEDKGFFAYSLKMDKKDFLIDSMILFQVKTAGGLVYVQTNSKGEKFCFLAHVFDRFAQRNNKMLIRKDAIRQFCKCFLGGGYLLDKVSFHQDKLQIFLDGGILLGEIIEGVHIFKTYVTKEMATPEQKRILEREIAENPLSKIIL